MPVFFMMRSFSLDYISFEQFTGKVRHGNEIQKVNFLKVPLLTAPSVGHIHFFLLFLLFFLTGRIFWNVSLCLSAPRNANKRAKFLEEPDVLDLFRLFFIHLDSAEYDTTATLHYYTLV